MGSSVVAHWLAIWLPNATGWEIAATVVGIFAAGYALWGAIDNVIDLRVVRDTGVVDGPRWITAFGLLVANALFFASWLGYLHVAMLAVYLPPRTDVVASTLSDVAVMRMGYAVLNLLALAVLREMRRRLRNLPREMWAPMFGEAERYQALYREAHARALRVEAEFLAYRAENHDFLNREQAAYARGVADGRARAWKLSPEQDAES